MVGVLGRDPRGGPRYLNAIIQNAMTQTMKMR